jgi:outer membrane lipoprotein carrier protein
MKSLCLSALIFLMLAYSWMAQADEKVAQQLDNQLANLHSLQANFRQTIGTADGRVLQQSTGTMALQRPGKFRWVVEKPNKQLIIANHNKLWIYDEDLAQVTLQTVKKSQGMPAFLLSDDNQDILQKFKVSLVQTNEGGIKSFLLQPKQKDNLFSSMQLSFKQNMLQQIVMIDGLDQITTIKFSALKANSALSPGLFSFVPLPGVEVIDNRQ